MIIKTKNKAIAFFLVIFLSYLAIPYQSEAALVGDTTDAVLSLSPNVGVYKTGSTFTVDILLNTAGNNIVVTAAYLSYDPTFFQVVPFSVSQPVDLAGSVFYRATENETLATENIIDAVNGKVKLILGKPTPGVNTTSGKIATLTIKALKNTAPTKDNFSFVFDTVDATVRDSRVILNDGLATDKLKGVDSGKYTFDGVAPTDVSNFVATPGNNQITLSWTNPSSDFTGVKILRKTGSFPTSETDGTVIYDSNGTSYINTSLTNGTTYYYKAFAHDAVLNYAAGVQSSAVPGDKVAPASIVDLAVTVNSAKTVTLNWTAVGDNANTGTAASYDARYSTSAITAANFSSATEITGEPSPKASGSAETMSIGGLQGFTTYFFAIKAVDVSGNIGAISNIFSAKTYKISDLNNDGYVNTPDFGMLMSFWNYTTKPVADINQDGLVDVSDFGIMMSQWG